MTALDAARNGEISAEEIENAVAALRKLDKTRTTNSQQKNCARTLVPTGAAEVAVESQIVLVPLSPSR